MTAETTLTRFREYMVGPSRFITLLSCFELGLVDALRDAGPRTAEQLAGAAGVTPDAVQQLLHLLVKDDFVAFDEAAGTYALGGLADVADVDLQRVLSISRMIKVLMLRQGYYMTESVRAGIPLGLKEFYGFEGNVYDAAGEHPELRESWGKAMDTYTAHIDPWFFENVEIPAGAQVLDLAGNTGLGAILTHKLKGSTGLRVTTFDLPEKREPALRNFREHGVEDRCGFIGGDVFKSVPSGFDVVLIKHFLDMFDKKDVFAILKGVNSAVEPGSLVHVLVPVYPENVKDSYGVDFFPAFFLGCAMGKGGPQKLSTYRAWLAECGFEVTRAIAQNPADMPPDSWAAQAILSARKAG
ncbi:methyltransferase [Amycolatopsis sp. RTGN1]|uniref:methyltransferase n=1 Tax=Amycolatopsis ponsaeliensis TaxID=2992142 RepID=UPI00254D8431|nr:methyltransferase [Amycolatopsis sp. RTGN1]